MLGVATGDATSHVVFGDFVVASGDLLHIYIFFATLVFLKCYDSTKMLLRGHRRDLAGNFLSNVLFFFLLRRTVFCFNEANAGAGGGFLLHRSICGIGRKLNLLR
jgi:hypothetical protein